MICFNDPYNKYDFFQNKGKYSMLDISCQSFGIHIPKILVSHIHKNTIKSDEQIVSLQTRMQFLPTRLTIIMLHRVEEQFPAFRDIMLSAMCLCADKRIPTSCSGDLYGAKNKMFSRNVMLPFIFCGLSF
jgi:hypothetical protein